MIKITDIVEFIRYNLSKKTDKTDITKTHPRTLAIKLVQRVLTVPMTLNI